MTLAQHHRKMLAASGIDDLAAAERGYETVNDKGRLIDLKIAQAGRRVPGLLVPMRAADGSVWGYQYRPDYPRTDAKGHEVKYETPVGQRNGIDVPPGVGPQLGDIDKVLFITEGVKKADCAAAHGLCCIALTGVWGWRGTNAHGGKTAVSDWHDIALNSRRVVLAFDGDVARKPAVREALKQFAAYLEDTKGAQVKYLHLPDTKDKTGLDDYLVANGIEGIGKLVKPDLPPEATDDEPMAAAEPEVHWESVSLDGALETFRKYLPKVDVEAVVCTAAVLVANRAEGDPVWLLLVGPPSCGKTEILSAATPLPYVVASATITEAALLSGTSKKDHAKDATGGLLRKVGEFGVLSAKDFTSVLSQNKDTARSAMAALREVYDGSWDRPVGTDGGRVLAWKGKCGFIGGVTPAYDNYGAIVNALGDRFLLLRLPEVHAEDQAESALLGAQHEKEMREALAAAMCGLVTGADLELVTAPLTDEQRARLRRLAIFTARARTAVLRDGYTREVQVMPVPEGPARLAKALRQVYGGLRALNVPEDMLWAVLERLALGSVPAMRVPVMRVLLEQAAVTDADGGPMRTSDIAEAVGVVTKTAHRVLDDLALIKVAHRTKAGSADNAADLWTAIDWLTEYGDPVLLRDLVGPKSTNEGVKGEEAGDCAPSDPLRDAEFGTFRSHASADTCPGCNKPHTDPGLCPTCLWLHEAEVFG